MLITPSPYSLTILEFYLSLCLSKFLCHFMNRFHYPPYCFRIRYTLTSLISHCQSCIVTAFPVLLLIILIFLLFFLLILLLSLLIILILPPSSFLLPPPFSLPSFSSLP